MLLILCITEVLTECWAAKRANHFEGVGVDEAIGRPRQVCVVEVGDVNGAHAVQLSTSHQALVVVLRQLRRN